jgi:hypothetical protein
VCQSLLPYAGDRMARFPVPLVLLVKFSMGIVSYHTRPRQESCCGDSHPATLPGLNSANSSSVAFDVSVRPIVPFPGLHSGFNLEMICRRREHLGPPLGAFALRALANVFLAFGYVSVCRTLLQICTNLISSCMGGMLPSPDKERIRS